MMARSLAVALVLVTVSAEPSQAGYQLLWSELLDLTPTAQPTTTAVGDVDGDGALEVVGRFPVESLRIVDAMTGVEEFSVDIGGAVYGVALLDLDGDSILEVLAWTSARVAVVDFVGVASTPQDRVADHPGRGLAAYPNPFNGSSIIPFTLGAASQVEIRIHDVTGRLVRRLNEGNLGAGDHAVTWDSRNDAGERLASGQYFYSLVVNREVVETRKTVVLR